MGDLLYQYENVELGDSRNQSGFYSTEQEIQEPVSLFIADNKGTCVLKSAFVLAELC